MNTHQLTPSNEPFKTTDAELAVALLTAGCSLASPEQGGPAQMHYTPDICRNRWVTIKDASGAKRVPLLSHTSVTPATFEEAVIRAGKLGIPGEVNFFILRDEVFLEAMQMHDFLAKEAQLAALQHRALVLPKLSTLSETQQVMVICYVRRQNREKLDTHAWARAPLLAMGDVRKKLVPRGSASEAQLTNSSFVMEGSGKIWKLGLSDERRASTTKDGKRFLHPKPVSK